MAASVLRLLSKDFVQLVIIAILLALPVAWYLMDQWLVGFAYRIQLQWWVFAFVALAALGVALLTLSSQALKAALANPVDSLRNE